jgi:hypothetical protein
MMEPRVLATMITTTSYGTWLPGDLRGYVQAGIILPPNPNLLEHSKRLLSKEPVIFTSEQQQMLFAAIVTACAEFHYRLLHVSIESWHLHWIASHGFDSVAVMVGRLKNRMRQALVIGRIWTEGYYERCLFSEAELDTAAEYVARHHGYRALR